MLAMLMITLTHILGYQVSYYRQRVVFMAWLNYVKRSYVIKLKYTRIHILVFLYPIKKLPGVL